MDFAGAEGGGGVGGEVGVAGASGEDDDVAGGEVFVGAVPGVGFGHFGAFEGCEDFGGAFDIFQGLLEGDAVDEGGEHAHLVGGGAGDLHGGVVDAAEDVAASDDKADFETGVVEVFDGGG